MKRPLGSLWAYELLEISSRSRPENRADHVVFAAAGDRKGSERSTECSQLRSDSRSTEQPAELIYVPVEDVLADIAGEMVVTNELWGSLEDRPGRRDQGFAQIMNNRQGDAPIPANVLEGAFDLAGVLGAHLAALEHLPAQRVEAHQEDAAAFFASPVDVEDVASTLPNVAAKQGDALLMNDLYIRYEPQGKVADCPCGQIDRVLTEEICSNLLELSTLHETRDADVHKEVVSNVAGWGDQPRELERPGGSLLRVVWTEALLFNSLEFSVGEGYYGTFAGGKQEEPLAADLAQFLLRTESETGNGREPSFQGGGCLLALVSKDVEDRDRALFLSRSYRSKTASTTARDAATPERWQRGPSCARVAWGSLINSKSTVMTCCGVATAFRRSSRSSIRRRFC